jgi:hypothetical protein
MSGKLDGIGNYLNILEQVILPYKADVFIDTWIPFGNTSIRTNDKSNIPQVIEEYAEKYRPKMMVLDNFDDIPLTHQIRKVLPKSAMTYGNVVESTFTNKENVMFMWYKIWKVNQLRKLYEQANRIRYDCIIRLRMDTSFKDGEFPVIEPKRKSVYIPIGGDYEGGICDMLAIADPITMDLYCELYNEIYRYATAGIGIHPESMLRKHLEINRLNIERFDCTFALRGNIVPKIGEALVTHTKEMLRLEKEKRMQEEFLRIRSPTEILKPED